LYIYGVHIRYVVHIRCTYTVYIYGVNIRCTYTVYIYGSGQPYPGSKAGNNFKAAPKCHKHYILYITRVSFDIPFISSNSIPRLLFFLHLLALILRTHAHPRIFVPQRILSPAQLFCLLLLHLLLCFVLRALIPRTHTHTHTRSFVTQRILSPAQLFRLLLLCLQFLIIFCALISTTLFGPLLWPSRLTLLLLCMPLCKSMNSTRTYK